MKYLLLILVLLNSSITHAQVQPLTEQEQIDQMSVDNSIHALVNRLDQDCQIKINPKNQVDDPDCTPNPNLPPQIVQCKMDDPADLSTNYERMVIEDVKFLNCQAGTVRSRQQLNCAEVMLPSCPTPVLADLEAELPVYKAERQLNLDKDNERKSDVARQSAISGWLSVIIPEFKLAYPEYANMDEGAIRRDIYNSFGTEAKMAKLEELAQVHIDAENAAKAQAQADKARAEDLLNKQGLTPAELEELIKLRLR